MISDGRPCDVHCIVKIVHDLTRADQRGGLYSALKLVAGIEVVVGRTRQPDVVEHLGHGDISDRIMTAIAATLASPTTRTADLGGTSDTEGVTTAVVAALGTS
jgi:hypothetical protein